jgi:hypothetical protein
MNLSSGLCMPGGRGDRLDWVQVHEVAQNARQKCQV